MGLPRLRNLVNVYMSSNNPNDSVYMELPDLIFFSLCRSVKLLIFFLEKLVRIFEIVWLGVVIELISSNWKVIATCADRYITDIFFSCKCVISELTLPIIRYCQLSMSAIILIAVDTLSNTTESEKTNKLIDDPERDVY